MLDDPEAQTEFLALAFQDGDPSYIVHALGIVARAKGKAQVSEDVGISRVSLHQALSSTGDPKLSTLLAVAKALGSA